MACLILDASVLVAFTRPNDEHHDAAVRIVKSHPGQLAMASITAAEYLVHPARSGAAMRAWDILTNTDKPGSLGIEILPERDFQTPSYTPWAVKLAELQASTRPKMPDVVVLATALAHGRLVTTFDTDLAEAAAQHHALYIHNELDPD